MRGRQNSAVQLHLVSTEEFRPEREFFGDQRTLLSESAKPARKGKQS
jgi:hypothetical protein